MDNRLLEYIRLRNLFSPEAMTPEMQLPVETGLPERNTQPPLPVNPTNPESDELSMLDLYTPETRMTERMLSMLDEFPERNKPGIGRKIVASLSAAGRGGINAADRVLYKPYYEDLDEWKEQFEPISSAAQHERLSNNNLRQIAANIISQRQSDKRIERMMERDRVLREQGERRLSQGDTRLEQGDTRLAQGDRRLDQRDAELEIRRELAKGGTFEVDDAGNAFIVRKDGSTVPVDASYLTFEQKSELLAQRAERVTRARESGKRDRLALRPVEQPDGTVIYEVVNLDEAASTPVTEAPPKKNLGVDVGAVKRQVPKSELDVGREVTNRAQNVKNSNAQWNKWIKIEPGGRVTITRPGWFSGPSQEEYNKIYEAIYGKIPSVRRGQPAPSGTRPPKGQEGKVHVKIKGTNTTGWVTPPYDKTKYEEIP